MPIRSSLLVATSYLCLASAGYAATQEEADAIKASFQKYLTNQAGVVAVSIEGDAYKLTIDASPLIQKLPGSELKVQLSPLSYMLKPLGGDRWNVSTAQPLEMSIDVASAVSGRYSVKNYRHSGIYNTTLGAFESQEYNITDFKMKQTTDDAELKQDDDISIASITGKQTSKANSKGGLDSVGEFDILNQKSVQITKTKPAAAIPFDLTIDTNTAIQKGTTAAVNIKSREILDIMAWLVANNSEEAIKKNQEQLRSLVNAALPLFDSLNTGVKVGKTTFKTNYGDGSVASFDYVLDLNGLIEQGKFAQDLSLSGLELPLTVLPDWGNSLLPSDVSLGFSIEGFNAEAVTKLLVDNFDLSAAEPLKPDVTAQLLGAALPSGTLAITIKPGNIKSKLYTLSYEGSVQVQPSSQPTGIGKVKFTGFQATMDALQKAAQSDPSVNQAIGPLLAAQGFAKQEGDTLIWNLEATSTGGLLVNGIDLSKMGGP
jgi:hypothetical protein